MKTVLFTIFMIVVMVLVPYALLKMGAPEVVAHLAFLFTPVIIIYLMKSKSEKT